MKSQITMKDLAAHFGVSLNTVHKALTGKSGVGEATRKKITDYAEEMGYQRNTAASFLKRQQIRILLCLPNLNESSKYFYHSIWQGCREYFKEWQALNIELIEYAYSENKLQQSLEEINQTYYSADNAVDGLIVPPAKTAVEVELINSFIKKGTKVVFVTGDNPQCDRLGAVIADYYTAGKLMAEQACNLVRNIDFPQVLLLAGSEDNEAHYLVAQGFEEYVQQEIKVISIKKINGYFEMDTFDKSLLSIVKAERPDIVCSVFARGSVALIQVLKASGLARQIPAIGNDVFPENTAALKKEIFTNLIFKNPHQQAYSAAQMLCDALVNESSPETDLKRIEVQLICKSNVDYYR